jgi:MFS family permease
VCSCGVFQHPDLDLFPLLNILGLVIYVLPINMGYDLGMTGNLLAVPTFLTKFGQRTSSGTLEISARDQQVLNAASSVGLAVAAFATGILSDWFGRRKVVITACVITVAGALVQGFCKSIDMLFGGKLIGCIGFGLGHALGPVFVAEIAPPRFRGTLLSLVVSVSSLFKRRLLTHLRTR